MLRVLLALACVVAATRAENSYVVIAPSKIRPNMNLDISVNILKAPSSVVVTAAVLRSKTPVASGSGVFAAGTPGTIRMKLPDNLPQSSYTLQVTGSGGLTFVNTTTLGFTRKDMSLFIQSDKAMYKPGDKVQFRVFGVDPELKSYTGNVDLSIYDASGNKIKQWLQVSAANGVISQSLALSSQPVLGDWRISATAGSASTEKVFTIAEYVLPKFEVDVVPPSYVVTTENSIDFTVKAKYTYGKPVKGTLDVAVKMHYSYQTYDSSADLPVYSVKVPIDGEAKVSVPMSTLTSISKYINGRKLTLRANVTESLTGNTLNGTGSVEIFSKAVKLEFPKSNSKTFKPGLKYTAYLKISQPDGLPVASSNRQVKLATRVSVLKKQITTPPWYFSPPTTYVNLPEQLLSVPTNGLVPIIVDAPSDAHDVHLTATYDTVTTSLNVGKSYSPSDSYIQLALKSNNLQAGNNINFEVKATQPVGSMVYQVLSRGAIVDSGKISGNMQSTFTFSIGSTSEMAPNARIVVYYVRTDGEIVTDSMSFDIEGAFENKVSVSVNTTDAEPGDKVQVTVTADPKSQAYLLAIDQSVLLLKSGNDVSASDVYDELKSYDTIAQTSSHTFGGIDFGVGIRPLARMKRMIWWPYPVSYGGSDATQIFKNVGVVVITDALVFRHVEPIPKCGGWRCPVPMFGRRQGGRLRPAFALAMQAPVAMGRPAVMMDAAPMAFREKAAPQKLATVERVRNVFPETWIWTEAAIGANGQASIVTSVPDTITSWVTSAFAVNQATGLGIAPSAAHLKVFRPFFVSLNLPYSVVRGEQLALQAIVFNYMTSDMRVKVTLAQSSSFFNIIVDSVGFESTVQQDAVQEIMVKAGEAKSVYFPIIPADLGRMDIEVKAQSTRAADAVRRQLLVEAEGVPKEYNVPVLVDLTGGRTSFVEIVDLTLPPNVVTGSELVRVSAVGDLMGPSIQGLDALLRMPTGCGEQTMLGLAPDVYITDYLQATNQLSGSIQDKALNYMESGYQRELTYKHKDGSFSAFGDRDDSGSMWLTAFVSRVFHQAKSHIFVDDKVIETAINWMIGHQFSNGSFAEPGRVIHKNMQGNAGKGTGLTVFVFISLMENQDLFKTGPNAARFENAKKRALGYIESEVAKTNDLYVLCMASYALQLANSTQTAPLLGRLQKLASYSGGLMYWHQPDTATSAKTGTWHRPNSAKAVDTEMTSYVLLTYASRQDISSGRNIVQWIAQQRNPNGGFSSTQDTVVALNAMSDFARQTFGNGDSMQVTTELNATTTFSFNINSANSLVMQSRETTKVPAKVKVAATGKGLSLVEIGVFFNVESEVETVTFDLQVNLLEETLNTLRISACASWLGEGAASGMAIQEIGIPSGFDADLESIPKLKTLKRVETQNKKLVLYFDEIDTHQTCVSVKMDRTGLVSKSQPAAVRVYDYYEPKNQMTAFYQSQILKDSTICDVCVDCENCVKRR